MACILPALNYKINLSLYMERRVLHTDKITIQPAIVGCTLAHPN